MAGRKLRPKDSHEPERGMIAVGVLMQWNGDDARSATRRLTGMARRGRKSMEATSEVVIGAAEMGCELNCGDNP
jgi:hypothetical protein